MRKLILSLAAVVAMVAAPASVAHAATPLVQKVDVVRALATDTWTFKLAGGEDFRIVVRGDGDTDLDAYLYDENGNLVASDTDETDLMVLDITPIWTGSFTLKIVNRGDESNRYRLTID